MGETMSFLGRIAKGAVSVLTSPIRAAMVPFSFASKMLGTGLKALGQLATLHPLKAMGTLVGGTAKNAMNAGITLASAGNPAIAFADGFARDSVRFS